MTITATVPKNPYTASGSGVFIYSFKISDAADMTVYLDGVQILTGFVVDGVGSETGGTVTITPTPTNGVKVLLARKTGLNQGTDWKANDPDPAESKENAFDKAMSISQEQNEILARTPQYKITETTNVQPRIDPVIVGSFARGKNSNGDIDWALPVPTGALSIPVSLAQGGTGSNFASIIALAKGLGLALW